MNNRLMRQMNVTKIMRMLPMVNRKKRGRNTLLLSLLGATVAGGATIYGMRRGKNGGNMQNMMKQVAGKINTQQLLKTQ